MKRRNRTEFAILGMLTHGPMSGYDLKSQFEERISHFWSESIGQIYPTLTRLVAAEQITGRDRTRPNGPKRVEYKITAKGKAHLRSWLIEPVGKEQLRNELLLKMFFGPESSVEINMHHIETFEAIQKTVKAQFKHYTQRIDDEQATELQRVYWRLTLLSGQLVNQARLKWCREAKRMLSEYAETS